MSKLSKVSNTLRVSKLSKASKLSKSKHAGLTLVELIVVLAIVAIIGAILIPNFLGTTDRARLRSDIQSARVIQNAIDLYNAERPIPISATMPMHGEGSNTIIAKLYESGYINDRQTLPQTYRARFAIRDQSTVVVDITNAQPNVRNAVYRQLSERERGYIIGGVGVGSNP